MEFQEARYSLVGTRNASSPPTCTRSLQWLRRVIFEMRYTQATASPVAKKTADQQQCGKLGRTTSLMPLQLVGLSVLPLTLAANQPYAPLYKGSIKVACQFSGSTKHCG